MESIGQTSLAKPLESRKKSICKEENGNTSTSALISNAFGQNTSISSGNVAQVSSFVKSLQQKNTLSLSKPAFGRKQSMDIKNVMNQK